ncbi:MAG: non-homologous end-joining DNA ligase [Acidimicrobiales bacterium]
MTGARVRVEVAGRELSLSNLDKILYPASGTTKAETIDYYVRIAPVMLPHLSGRCITLRRWPDGVDGPSFFEKRCPTHRPDWVPTAIGPGDRRGPVDYCRLEEPAALAWTANLAALELHAPMARCADLESPTMLVFDLDPGEPATIVECAQVALRIRELLDSFSLASFAKTSGSKGMQLLVPLNAPHTHDHASDLAQAVARLLEQQTPDAVTSTMKRSLRPGKIFVDWSQNSRHKTTIAAYSLRARPTPTVSAPITWDEVAAGAAGRPLSFEMAEVLDRVEAQGDPLAPVLTMIQHLPTGR